MRDLDWYPQTFAAVPYWLLASLGPTTLCQRCTSRPPRGRVGYPPGGGGGWLFASLGDCPTAVDMENLAGDEA